MSDWRSLPAGAVRRGDVLLDDDGASPRRVDRVTPTRRVDLGGAAVVSQVRLSFTGSAPAEVLAAGRMVNVLV